MKIVVIAAENEICLVRSFEALDGCPVLVTGVGAANVIEALRWIPRDVEIVNVGYAGSVDIPIGTVCRVSTSGLLHSVDYRDRTYELGGDTPCFSSSDFVTRSDRRGCLFDMELAYICALGFRTVEAVKVVSDNCSYNEYANTITE